MFSRIHVDFSFIFEFWNRPFPSSPEPLYQNEVKCSAFDMEIIIHSYVNKTYFRRKGFALGLILKVRVFWNSEVAYSSGIK